MNIREIASKAAVSTATVSRVLNGNPRVSEGNRRRVLDVVKELNYVPSGIARSMTHGRTSILGLILPDITNPFFPELARGVEDAAHTRNYNVVLCNTDGDPDSEVRYMRMLREHRADGVILIPSRTIDPEMVSRNMGDIPVIWCDRVPEQGLATGVTTDNYHGAVLATEHLLQLGHRKLGMISGPQVPASEARERGFLETCRRYGVITGPAWMADGDFRYESGYDGMLKIFAAGRTRPSAVFCCNDLMAIGAMDAAINQGIGVPDELSIVGYDNIFFTKFSRPPLTTVNQPTYLLGVTAVEMLNEQVGIHANHERQGRIQVLKPGLVVRNSTSKVKS